MNFALTNAVDATGFFKTTECFFFSHGLLSDISTASDVSRGASGVRRQRNVQVFNERVRERIPVSQHCR